MILWKFFEIEHQINKRRKDLQWFSLVSLLLVLPEDPPNHYLIPDPSKHDRHISVIPDPIGPSRQVIPYSSQTRPLP